MRLTLCDTADEMLVPQPRCALTQCYHASFNAYRLQLGPVELIGATCKLLEVDIGADGHLAGVNLKNTCASRFRRQWELNFAIEPSRPKKRGVKNVNTICCGNDLYNI
jgi:hypothetical protein